MKKSIWYVTCAVFMGQVLFAMANNAQGVLLSEFIGAFSLSSASQGLPSAAANAGILAAMLLAVPMAARFGKMRLYAGGLGLMGLMLLLCGASASAGMLTCAWLAMGFAFGCIDTTASSLVADLHQGRQAARLMGVLHAVYGTGGILAPVLMGAALSAGGTWRTVLNALGLVVLAVFLVCAFVFAREGKKLPGSEAPRERMTRESLAAFVRQKGNLLFVLCAVLYCAHFACIYLWVSRVIGVGFDNPALGAAALSLFWVGTVASRLVVPLTGISTVRYMRFGMLLTAAALAASALIGGGVAVCVAVALSGLIAGATLPMILSEMGRRNPERSMLAITAVLLTTAISAMVCAPLIGFVVGKTSLLAAMAISAVFALGTAACAFGLRDAV